MLFFLGNMDLGIQIFEFIKSNPYIWIFIVIFKIQ